MRQFTLAPTSSDAHEIDIQAYDETAVLHAIDRAGFDEAEVYENGDYRFSLRLEGGGVWYIYQRDSLGPACQRDRP